MSAAQRPTTGPAAGKARAFHPTPKEDIWSVGDLLLMSGKIWRVGYISDIRMRLDPITGHVTKIYDHEFETYGGSVNVSPNSVLERVTEEHLTDVQRKRAAKLDERGNNTEERIMAAEVAGAGTAAVKAGPAAVATAKPAVAAVAGAVKAVKPAAAAQPVAATVSDNKTKNAERIAALKAKKVAAAPEKKSPVEKKEKVKRQCSCGCDAMVTGYFAQGHDARFKGWLLKIERGTMAVKDLPTRIQKAYEWKKVGDGMMPTKNYKGEPHSGYAKDTDEA